MSSLTLMLMFAMFAFMGAARGRRQRRWHRDRDHVEDRAGREVGQLRDHVADLSVRLNRLEEERDFYRELLGAETRFRGVDSGSPEAVGQRGSQLAP